MADNYGIAGQGSFGIVIEPALPNINNNGNRLNFPQNISKIYVNRSSYRNALSTSRKIKNTIPSLNINTHTYKKKYTIGNLPNSIKQKIRKFMKEKYGEFTTNHNELPILRMPNLGYDASEISYKPELYRRLRQIPFRQICYEMYKCMNVVKAIHAAGYIHGDIRETNILCNVDNAKMTIIDFDWLKPFNEIYNTYPEFYYPYPPECLFIFGRKKQHKYDINIKSLFRADMSVRSNDTILKFYETVINKYDYYIPQDATNGMRNFLNTIKPFQTTARNQNEWYEDIENYENNTRFELFNIAKDYIDMYGLGIAFYRLLKHTWGSNVLIQGINVNNGVVIELKDLSEGMKNGTIIMSGIDKNDVKEIEAFSNMRKFIFEELLPGMCHSNYARRWTIDEAIDIFREKLEEIGVDMRSNDEKLASDELKRMELLALIRNNKYEGVNNNGAIISKIKPKYYNESNPFAIFANNNNNNNKTNGGKRYKGKRKTRKNRRN